MTGSDLADLIGAVAVGRKQRSWEAPCPVHGDKGCRLRITNGFKGAADVKCPERCSIYRIVERWGLDWEEFCSRPVPTPEHADMSDDEIAEYRAAQRNRQAKHMAVCYRLRAQEQIVAELEATPSERWSPKLKREWKDARLMLRSLEEEEEQLRAPGTSPKHSDDQDDPDNFEEYDSECEGAQLGWDGEAGSW